MTTEKLKENISEILQYLLGYAERELKKEGKSPFENKTFVNKVNEGFKKAQIQIVRGQLEIEEELKKCRAAMLEQRRRKPSQYRKDPDYKENESSEFKLVYQLNIFKQLANVMAWHIFEMDRTQIKSFIKEGMWNGYLIDKNTSSVIDTANEINTSADQFALITDITSCLGEGDLVVINTTIPNRTVIEVKEGEKNKEFYNIIYKDIPELLLPPYEATNQQTVEVYRERRPPKEIEEILKTKSDPKLKYDENQLRRLIRQQASLHEAIGYIHTGKRIDPYVGINRHRQEVKEPTGSFLEEVNQAMEDVRASGNIIPLAGDCIAVVIKKAVEGDNLFKEFCAYLQIFHNIPIEKSAKSIFQLKDGVMSPSHMPIFMLMSNINAVDLLTEKINVLIYFDYDCFFVKCQQAGLKPQWINDKDLQKRFRSGIDLAKFPKGYLSFRGGDVSMVMGYGTFWKIVYEMQSVQSIIKQLSESLKQLREAKDIGGE